MILAAIYAIHVITDNNVPKIPDHDTQAKQLRQKQPSPTWQTKGGSSTNFPIAIILTSLFSQVGSSPIMRRMMRSRPNPAASNPNSSLLSISSPLIRKSASMDSMVPLQAGLNQQKCLEVPIILILHLFIIKHKFCLRSSLMKRSRRKWRRRWRRTQV